MIDGTVWVLLVGDGDEVLTIDPTLVMRPPEMRRDVIAHVNRLFPKAATKLRDVSDGNVIQCPQSVFIESLGSLLDSDLDAVG